MLEKCSFLLYNQLEKGEKYMRLKKLELQGFKSFADKTEIIVLDGVTTIVGPNGSGKVIYLML